MIKLGSIVRDKHTGFEGLAVMREEWDNGLVRIGIESSTLRMGEPTRAFLFDIERVEAVPEG